MEKKTQRDREPMEEKEPEQKKTKPKCCVVLSSNTDMNRKEKILVGCEVLYTRLAGRLSRITARQCFISQAGS